MFADFYRSLLLHVDVEPLKASILSRITEITGCRCAALVLLDAARGDLTCAAASGPWPEPFLEASWRSDRGLCRWLAINERPLAPLRDLDIVADLPPDEAALLADAAVELVVPLEAASHLTGFLCLGPIPAGQGESSGLVATLAVPMALALEHAALVKEEERRLQHLYRAERLATAGTIAAGLAHEIRNPLTAIRSGVQLLAGRRDVPPDAAEVMADVIHEVDRINHLVDSLLMFARAPRAALQPVDVRDVARRAVALVEPQARKAGVTLQVELGTSPAVVDGDAGELEQVVLNLILNAVQATPAGTAPVTVGAGITGTAPHRRAAVTVRDHGPGLAPDLVERIFDPFFTTKADGSGLGLPISYAIVRRHRGELTVTNGAPEEGGVHARVHLPLRKDDR